MGVAATQDSTFDWRELRAQVRRDLSKESFLRWADEMFSWATHVGLLFGAEPTLNPNLLSFVRIAKELRVPNVYFSTNAMKLTPALTGALIEAGLYEINVSLDAGTKATFERIRRGAKWDTVVGHLKSLRDQKAARKLRRPRIHLSFVMMRSNVQELPQFIELAAELGVEVVYFSHLVPFDVLGMIDESLGRIGRSTSNTFIERFCWLDNTAYMSSCHALDRSASISPFHGRQLNKGRPIIWLT
jgi:molybdenum cofactor biosynthesis enzyme MoaA